MYRRRKRLAIMKYTMWTASILGVAFSGSTQAQTFSDPVDVATLEFTELGRHSNRTMYAASDRHIISAVGLRYWIVETQGPTCDRTLLEVDVRDVFPGCPTGSSFALDSFLYDQDSGRWVAIALATGGQVCIGTAADPTVIPWDYRLVSAPFVDRSTSPRSTLSLAVWPTDRNGGAGSYFVFGHDVSPYDSLAPTGLPDLSVYQDRVLALNRQDLLSGIAPATQLLDLPHHLDARPVEFQLSLASHAIWQGADLPPSGASYPIALARDTEIYPGPTPAGDLVEVYPLQVDWNDPTQTTLGPPQEIVVADFNQDICPFGRTPAYARSPTPTDCIEMPGGSPERNHSFWMGEMQYLKRGSTEYLNGAIPIKNADGSAGVQWFSLQRTGASGFTLDEQGTLPVDGSSRWAASTTMDENGHLFVAVNESSAADWPAIELWARRASDPAGSITLVERAVSSVERPAVREPHAGNVAWLDPFDGCTVHYVRQVQSRHFGYAYQVRSLQSCDCESDLDGDGLAGSCDNCPEVSNPMQVDADEDRVGDACDACLDDPINDLDEDGLCGGLDPCEDCEQLVDPDGDGACFDNCPDVANPLQRDADSDGLGDACDDDDDNDGVLDDVDNCQFVANPLQPNFDGDSLGNACDNCPSVDNENQANMDLDPFGDACDRCIYLYSEDNLDSDGDGQGNACDVFPLCHPELCDLHIDPNGPPASGIGSDCFQCGAGFDFRGRVGTSVPGSGEEFLGFGLSMTSSLGPCPPEMMILDLCCPDAICPDAEVSQLYPDPIGTIDLLSTDFNVDPDSGFGMGLEFIVDLDGDGARDSAVGAPYEDRVDLIGSQSQELLSTVFGNGELFGFSLENYPTGLLIGAPGPEPGALAATNGRFVLMDPVTLNFDLDVYGTTAGGRFGWDLAPLEDLDADGRKEIVIGAPGIGSTLSGSVWIYRTDSESLTEIAGDVVGEEFGFAVDTCDHDGDGQEDIVVGAPKSLDGSSSVVVGRVDVYEADGTLMSRLYGDEPNGEFGASVSCGEDVDGDGIHDVLVGSPGAEANQVANSGRAYLYNVQETLLAKWSGTNGERLGRNVLLATGQNTDPLGDPVVSDARGGLDGRGTSRVYISDQDADGVDVSVDNCPGRANADQVDADGDGFGDVCDLCPFDFDDQTDTDGDGAGDVCDCDPEDAAIHPGAEEILDGKDNQCPGDTGFGQLDEFTGMVSVDRAATGETTISWTDVTPAEPNDVYEMARASEPSFFSNCSLTQTTSTSVVETEDPLSGEAFYYLVRHGEPHFGSWGDMTDEGPRLPACSP